MRVVSGEAKGRILKTLDGNDIVRPTGNKIKEAVFSSIQFMLQGRIFLDLFAGSGQIGIEALSRGVKQAYFVDSSRSSVSVIKQNLDTVGFSDRAVVINSDFEAFTLSCNTKFDIAFLDPPYSKGLLERALFKVSALMNIGGKIICENPYDENLPKTVGDFVIDREYKYGKIKITSYVHKSLLS